MKEYEALFIVDASKEDSLKEVITDINGAIAKSEGKVEKEENWGKQRLPYPINKQTEGIYYKLAFSLNPSQVSVLNNNYKLNPSILRVMITAK